MNIDSRIEAISTMYGSDNFRGRKLKDMTPAQIGAIYEQLLCSGKFEEYEAEKQAYISLFPNARYEAAIRASKLSIFELRRVIPQILRSREEREPVGYQYTIFDIIARRQGEEQEHDDNNEAQRAQQKEHQDDGGK